VIAECPIQGIQGVEDGREHFLVTLAPRHA
jgi:hypothetical protein